VWKNMWKFALFYWIEINEMSQLKSRK
jgi:hypothetical protein